MLPSLSLPKIFSPSTKKQFSDNECNQPLLGSKSANKIRHPAQESITKRISQGFSSLKSARLPYISKFTGFSFIKPRNHPPLADQASISSTSFSSDRFNSDSESSLDHDQSDDRPYDKLDEYSLKHGLSEETLTDAPPDNIYLDETATVSTFDDDVAALDYIQDVKQCFDDIEDLWEPKEKDTNTLGTPKVYSEIDGRLTYEV